MSDMDTRAGTECLVQIEEIDEQIQRLQQRQKELMEQARVSTAVAYVAVLDLQTQAVDIFPVSSDDRLNAYENQCDCDLMLNSCYCGGKWTSVRSFWLEIMVDDRPSWQRRHSPRKDGVQLAFQYWCDKRDHFKTYTKDLPYGEECEQADWERQRHKILLYATRTEEEARTWAASKVQQAAG